MNDRTPDPEHVEWLVSYLAAKKDWVKSFDIRMDAISAYATWNDRDIRALARASAGRIGSGQHGYKLVALMTPDEAAHASNWLRSQGRDMIARAAEIETAWREANSRLGESETVGQGELELQTADMGKVRQ